ncbi:19950_t:CDS:2, partial [Funneliformis geosporum]
MEFDTSIYSLLRLFLTRINALSTRTLPLAETAVPTLVNYDLMSKPALLIGRHKLDAQTGQPLAKNQKIFRHYDYHTAQTTYFYRTNEQLVGQVANPTLLKKNYRLGTRSLNPLSLLSLATKHSKKE